MNAHKLRLFVSLSLFITMVFSNSVISKVPQEEVKKKFDRKSAVEFSLSAAKYFILFAEYPKADESYSLIINIYDPNNPVALSRRAVLKAEHFRDFEGALKDADDAIWHSILRFNINYLKEAIVSKGLVSYYLHDYKQATMYCNYVYFFDKSYDQASLCLLRSYMTLRKYEDVIQLATQLMNSKLEPNIYYYEALKSRTIAYLTLWKNEEALKDANELEEKYPNDRDVYNFRARTNTRLKNYEHAYKDFVKDAKLNPGRNNYSEKGITLGYQGKHKEALTEFEKAVKEDPSNASNLSNLAIAYNREEQYEKAKETAEKALELDPTISACYSSLATVAFYSSDYNKALGFINKSIEIKAKENDADSLHTSYLDRCEIYAELKKFDLALQDCNKSIELEDDSPWAYKNRAKVYFYSNKKEKALKDALKAKSLVNLDDVSFSKSDNKDLEELLKKLQTQT